LHVHTYTVELQLQAEALVGPGHVTDSAELTRFGWYLDDQLDHRFLNDVLTFQPTSEAPAKNFFGWCTEHLRPKMLGAQAAAVRVSETPLS
jgi:6-pyruvoyltetrahydropterin/6-carboxytetrahydropterin synthase